MRLDSSGSRARTSMSLGTPRVAPSSPGHGPGIHGLGAVRYAGAAGSDRPTPSPGTLSFPAEDDVPASHRHTPATQGRDPCAYALTELILDAVRRHKQDLVEHIRTALPAESQAALDALFEKGPSFVVDLKVQRSRLTLLKQFSHSTKPSMIKANVADLGTIGDLYRPGRYRPHARPDAGRPALLCPFGDQG